MTRSNLNTYEYRILAENTSQGVVYSIHEVEIDRYRNAVEYTKLPITLIHTDLERMIIEIEEVLEAFDKPVLSIEHFPDMF